MNVIEYPAAYQSAFRPALFVLNGVSAAEGIDVSILPASGTQPLGVKRIYGEGEITVNAAPYVRGLLSPEPLCGQSIGVTCDQRRYAGCRISADGYTSPEVFLTGGTEDAVPGRILSAAPSGMKIRPGERDEISVVAAAGAAVKPFIVFTHGGAEYTVDSLQEGSGAGMHTFVVDSGEVVRMFSEKTGAGASEMKGFTAMLRVSDSGGDTYLTRRYTFDTSPHNGRRLAWVNRYGAIDYYTFPATAEQTASGVKERIASASGIRVVAASRGESLTLESDYETAETLCWLAEIFSSPRVWSVGGGGVAEVDVADSAAGFDPMLPGRLAVKISPVTTPVSRKF